MRHNALQSIFCIILSITCTIGIDIAITCTDRWGSAASAPVSSVVSCLTGETMVSCGYSSTNGRVQGSTIDTSTNVCTASMIVHKVSTVTAVARCCTFPADAQITTSTIESDQDISVSVQCVGDSVLTGCAHKGPSTQYVKGSFSGVQSAPPQTAAWISSGNQCNAEGTSTYTVKAV
eukprot:208559_1